MAAQATKPTRVQDMPEALLAAVFRACVLRTPCSSISSAYDFALVCKSWHEIFLKLGLVRVPGTISPWTAEKSRQLQDLQEISFIHFNKNSLSVLDNSVICSLVEHVGSRVTSLTFHPEAAIQGSTWTDQALSSLASRCPLLTHLALPCGKAQQGQARMQAIEGLWEAIGNPTISHMRGCGIPEEFSRLQSLEHLDLRGVSVLSVPGFLGPSLSLLTTLRLHCRLRPPNAFNVAPSLSCLTALRTLEVRSPSLREIPLELSSLSSLSSLFLSSESLTSLPPSLFTLMGSSLRTLSLASCWRLTHLPPSTTALSTLCSLDLRNCLHLTETPAVIFSLSLLTHLDLRTGNLTSISSQDLGHFPGIRDLALQAPRSPPRANCRHPTDALSLSLAPLSSLRRLRITDEDSTALSTTIATGTPLWGPSITVLHAESLFSSCPTTLRRLDLAGLAALESISEQVFWLPGLRSLQELEVSGCNELDSLPVSISCLSVLTRLEVNDCFGLRNLPCSLGQIPSLVRLSLSHCPMLVKLPRGLSGLTKLRRLTLQGLGSLQDVTAELGQLTSLQTLLLSGLEQLRKVPDSAGRGLCSLRSLVVEGCPRIAHLPVTVRGMHSLTSLSIVHCAKLRRLPEDLGSLSSLLALRVSACERLQWVPTSVGELSGLRTLELTSLPSIITLPESVCQLRMLRHLAITGCCSMAFLPQGLLIGLGMANLSPGSKDALEAEWGQGRAGDLLEVTGQEFLQELPHSFEQLTGLTALAVRGCPLLEILPASLTLLTGLRSLSVCWCDSLASIPEEVGALRCLTELVILGCHSLETLPDALSSLTSLELLHVSQCQGIGELPDALGSLPSLTRLHISSCGSLTSLPRTLSGLRSLQELVLADMPELIDVPGLGKNRGMESLTSLRLSHCTALEHLPPSITALLGLIDLTVESCRKLVGIPDGVEDLPKLSSASRHMIWGLRREMLSS